MRNYLFGCVVLALVSVSFAANNTDHATSSANAAIGPESAQKANASNDKRQISLDKSDKSDKGESFWTFLKGTQPDNAVYLGMFTWHFNPESRAHDRWSNNLIGGLYNSIFVGTLLNSFSDRAFVVGVQRNLYTNQLSQNNQVNVGYRLGLISGYDQRMSDFAKYLPVLPIPELYIDYAYKNFGAELSYIGVVFTAKFFIRF
ncbi:hypothetical protein [Cysteiniphilum sp. 6C5]|uniref:hypothetical protein n=1 Tax=unclassified Cysteiniphilum TaxID=2610889 RepID=UPI003F84F683